MRIPIALIGCLALLLTTGCYNNPHTSEKKPGEGPENIHARPAVGPGTTDGGSTAGPQTAKAETPKAPAEHGEQKH